MVKKKNPQDATLRNIRALKKAVQELKLKVKNIEWVLFIENSNKVPKKKLK